PETKINRDCWSMMYGDATSSWASDGEGKLIAQGTISASVLRKTAQILPNRELNPTVRGRKLVITKKGFMGLAPSWAKAGDELAILFGCSMPVVLSRCHNHFHLR